MDIDHRGNNNKMENNNVIINVKSKLRTFENENESIKDYINTDMQYRTINDEDVNGAIIQNAYWDLDLLVLSIGEKANLHIRAVNSYISMELKEEICVNKHHIEDCEITLKDGDSLVDWYPKKIIKKVIGLEIRGLGFGKTMSYVYLENYGLLTFIHLINIDTYDPMLYWEFEIDRPKLDEREDRL